jgi:hypothetical protein
MEKGFKVYGLGWNSGRVQVKGFLGFGCNKAL